MLKTFWIKHFGYGTPYNVYFNACVVLAKAHSNRCLRPDFTVSRDLCRLYVHVGYDLVFECSLKKVDPPIIYKYGSWVGDLNEYVQALRDHDERLIRNSW